MTRICPQCGNRNDDTVKFCISCGNALGVSAVEPGTAPAMQPLPPAPAAPPGRSTTLWIIAVAAAVLVILGGVYFLQMSGIVKILPFLTPAATPLPALTPEVTSYIVVDTPLPETTVPETENSLNTTNVTESPVLTSTNTKPVVCPTDRRACGNECVDTLTDLQNCGGCNVTCDLREDCQQGHCMARCGGTLTSCPDGCHDLAFDAENCGVCGNTCPVGLVCNTSVCTPPQKTVIPTYAG